jgi:hypothetical protein
MTLAEEKPKASGIVWHVATKHVERPRVSAGEREARARTLAKWSGALL